MKTVLCYTSGILILVLIMLFIIVKMVKKKRNRAGRTKVPEELEEPNGKSIGRLGVFSDQPPTIRLSESSFVGFVDDSLHSIPSSPSVYYDAADRSKTPFESDKAKFPAMVYPWAFRLSQLTTIDAQLNRNTNPWSVNMKKM